MYKKAIILFLVAVLSASYAQAQITFGTRAGFNHTKFSVKEYGEKPDKEDRSRYIPGFQIGVVADYALSDAISIQPGVIYATQGAKHEWDNYFMSQMAISLSYLQIPVNIQYILDIGGLNLFLQTGPYLGYAISGKGKFWDTEGKRISDIDLKNKYGIEETKIKFGSKENEHNPFDFGIGLGIGMQVVNLQVGLGYNFGLIDIRNDADISCKNKGFTVTAIYFFGR